MGYADSVFEVAFVSVTGDQWWGSVIGDTHLADASSSFNTNYGTYYLTKEFEQGVDLSDAGLAQFADGLIYINSYFDYGSQGWYKPYNNGLGYVSGTNGLGSEEDWIVFADGRVGHFMGNGVHTAVSTQEMTPDQLQQGPGFVESVAILFPEPSIVPGFGEVQNPGISY